MIVGYVGNVRQGKTFNAVKDLKILYDLGYKIYSNTYLSFPYNHLTIDYILDIVENDLDIPDNCVFFIDEIHIWFDSRISGSKRNRIISYFMLQSGKLGNNTDFGLIILYTSQFVHQIDKRLRSVTDKLIESEKLEYRGEKYFILTINVFRGRKSFSYKKLIKGTAELYDLYDTRKKIKVEKDRYAED